MIKTVEKIYSNNVFTSYKIIFEDGRIYSVPLDQDNTDYQEVQLWIENGGTVIDNSSE
tara:strand:+ start:371 stop:544 length:174 start_codon:yes stop_codon:yes gene_type:complete